LIDGLEQQGISCIDMVTSAFLTVAQVRNKRAGAILAVSDECLNGKMGFRHPRFLNAEEQMVEVGLKAVHLLR
jgi:purine-nucleoside phosphorylase